MSTRTELALSHSAGSYHQSLNAGGCLFVILTVITGFEPLFLDWLMFCCSFTPRDVEVLLTNKIIATTQCCVYDNFNNL